MTRGTLNNLRRDAEFQFLTGGEIVLLLRDLVRREVLREHAVPDTARVSRLATLCFGDMFESGVDYVAKW